MVVQLNDIVRCQSMDNYCHIFLTSGKKVLMSKPLKHFADMLEPANFIRVHQSHWSILILFSRLSRRKGDIYYLKTMSKSLFLYGSERN